MTICYVKLTQGYFGGEKQTVDLLRQHAQVGERAILVALPGSALAKEAGRQGISVFQFPLYPYPAGRFLSLVFLALLPFHLPRAWALLKTLHSKEQVSVVCLQEPYEKIVFGLVASWIGIRIFWLEVISWEPFLVANGILFPFVKFMAKRATTIIVTSDHLAQEVGKYIRGCLLIIAKHGLTKNQRTRLQSLKSAPAYPIVRIGFIGNLHRLKGIFVLLEAWKDLIKRHPSLKLTFAGTGEDSQLLAENVESFGLSHSVNLVGYVSADTFFATTDLMVLPTLHENLPYVIQEAIYSKVPVVASRIGGIPELYSTQDALVTPDDSSALSRGIEWWLSRSDEQIKQIVSSQQSHLENKISFERYFQTIQQAYKL